MSATIEIPFALGEQLWSTGYGRHHKTVVCPECCGTRALEIVKGNGERLSVFCNYCQSGYDPPTGYVDEPVHEFVPTSFIPSRVDMSGGEFTYSESPPGTNAYSFQYAKDLFRDREECAKRCAELTEKAVADDARRVIANLESKRRDLAFSSHYWTRKVKDLRRDLGVAEARLAVCKERK